MQSLVCLLDYFRNLSLHARNSTLVNRTTFFRTPALAQGFFSTSHESPIGFAPIVETLVECAAPVDVVHEYARLVADADERFHLCVRLQLYDVAIEVRGEISGVQTCGILNILVCV